MATIRTAITLEDRMSRQFQALNRAMMSSIDYMRDIDRVSGNMLDTSAIEAAHRELQQVEAAFEEVQQDILRADDAQDRFNQGLRRSGGYAHKLLGTLGAIAGTYISLRGIGEVIRISDEMTDTTARVKLLVDDMPIIPEQSVNVNLKATGLSEIEQAQQLIFEAAQRSYSSYKDTADMVSRIGTNARDSFGSLSEVVAFSELVQKQFGIAGANATEASNATLQLSQALASGVLRGDELNSIFEQAPNLIQSIADYMDVPIGRIREMAKEGQITADIVKQSIFAAADDINDKFNSMPTTWSQIWTSMKNEALWAFKDILKGINDVANGERFKEFLGEVQQKIHQLATVAAIALNVLTTAGAFVYDNWSLIGPIVGGATLAMLGYVAALGAVKLASMASALWTAINTTAALIYSAAMGTSAGSTWAMVAAAWGLNSALWANPVFLVVAGVFALIAALYIGVAVFNHFAGTSISATGIIAGAFAVLGAFIYNRVAFLWNIFASFWEFFANISKDRTYAVKKLFYNLASNVLDQALAMSSGWDSFATGFVNAMISAVNGAIKAWNWFVNMLPDSVSSTIGLDTASEFTHRTSITSDLSNIKGKLKDWVGEAPADYWEAPKMDKINYSDAWNTGYDWGQNLFSFEEKEKERNDYNGMERYLAEQNALANGLNDKLGAGNQAGRDTAANTAKLAKSVEMLDDDLKYLRELAERDSVNRYTTAEIKVDMKNENYINNEMDIDGVIDRFSEKMEETAEMIAGGGEVEAF